MEENTANITNNQNQNSFHQYDQTITPIVNQIQEKLLLLNKKIKDYVIPILKSKNETQKKLESYKNKYNEYITKIKNKENIITDLSKSNPNKNLSSSIIKEEIQINKNSINDNLNIIKDIEKMNIILNSINKIKNKDEYKLLIQALTPFKEEEDGDNISNINKNELIDNIEIIDNQSFSEKNLLNKKRKREKVLTNSNNDSAKKPPKKEKIKQPTIKIDEEKVLASLKEKYPESKYIKKITKTFLQRRLGHKIIFEETFEYDDSDSIKRDKIKSSGDKTPYKYNKFVLKYKSDDPEKTSSNSQDIRNYFIENILLEKNYIMKVNDKKNIIEIAGKINKPLLELIENLFNGKFLFEKYKIVYAGIFSYEFYEELIYEFECNIKNDEDYNTEYCFVKDYYEESHLNKLRDNYKMLCAVRDYVKEIKKSTGNIGGNINNDATEDVQK